MKEFYFGIYSFIYYWDLLLPASIWRSDFLAHSRETVGAEPWDSHHLVLKSDPRMECHSTSYSPGTPKPQPPPPGLTNVPECYHDWAAAFNKSEEFSAINFPGACTPHGRLYNISILGYVVPIEGEYCWGSPGTCASARLCCTLRHFHSQHASGWWCALPLHGSRSAEGLSLIKKLLRFFGNLCLLKIKLSRFKSLFSFSLVPV